MPRINLKSYEKLFDRVEFLIEYMKVVKFGHDKWLESYGEYNKLMELSQKYDDIIDLATRLGRALVNEDYMSMTEPERESISPCITDIKSEIGFSKKYEDK